LGESMLAYNGPAVEGVNVGGAVRRYESRYFSQKIVPAGKPPWRNFCKSRRKIKLSRYYRFVQSRSQGFGR
jgi:hypothetical protein